ncbi:competence protein ComF [Vibrio galatheae]|uniref:Competence protein ComF n=1 Tax=Vibrio galatheae TaxID=579748 RepID=A0A0F4NLQ7_9VIBR|nr:amidophosphoribosyltransferase [Vibrio galatheae]KJY84110.1 competence protein ComF [Vibrio galatheae]
MLTQRVVKYIADLLPMHCEVCRLPLTEPRSSSGICGYCSAYFDPVPRCQRCGLPTLYQVAECGQCLKTPPSWQSLYCLGDYQQPLSTYVHLLKYERQFWHANKLGLLLAGRVERPAQLITYVPLHWRRYLKRGFNQSELIALPLARQLNLPCQPLFKRLRATPQQQGLSKVERRRNLSHAFTLNRYVNVDHVAIVDDVVTTGSTVQHLCDLLLEAGVKSVDIYCLCRTPEPAD